MFRLSTLLCALVISTNSFAFSSDFTLFIDPNNIGKDAGADGIWGTVDDAVNQANPIGAVSYVYSSSQGAFNPESYEAFGIGSFILETPGTTNSADYSAMSLVGTMPSSILPFEIGTLSLDNSVTSGINYTNGSQVYDSTITVQDPGGSSYTVTGTGYTLYNAPGFDDPSIFDGIFGTTDFYTSLQTHFDYLLGIVPESWTAITVDVLELDGTDIGVLMSSYSVDDDLVASAVPLPPAAWLLGTALFGLINCSRKREA